MTLYLESSAVLAGWLRESAGPEVAALVRSAERLAASDLTRVECDRAFLRAAALGTLSARELQSLQAKADTLWADCILLTFEANVVARARGSFPSEPIRTLDALHLAFFQSAQRALGDIALLSLDRRVRSAAQALGWPVLPA